MTRPRLLLAWLLILASTAQAMAAVAVACPDMEAAGAPASHAGAAVSETDAHPAQWQHDRAAAAGGAHADHSRGHGCCAGGLCSMNHCHALFALPVASVLLPRTPPAVPHATVTDTAPVHTASSPFRPPNIA